MLPSSPTTPTSPQLSPGSAHPADMTGTSFQTQSPSRRAGHFAGTAGKFFQRERHPSARPLGAVPAPKSTQPWLLASWEVLVFITFPSVPSIQYPPNCYFFMQCPCIAHASQCRERLAYGILSTFSRAGRRYGFHGYSQPNFTRITFSKGISRM